MSEGLRLRSQGRDERLRPDAVGRVPRPQSPRSYQGTAVPGFRRQSPASEPHLAASAHTRPTARPRILLIRPDHLGDVLLTRPAIDALVQALPEAALTVAVGPWGRPALGPRPPYRLLICPFPGFSRAHLPRILRYWLLLHYARLIRRERYTMAIIARPDHWWGALLAALAGIPIRIGYAVPETEPFLTLAIPQTPAKHAAAESLALAAVAARCLGRDLDEEAAHPLPTDAGHQERAMVDCLLTEAGAGDTPLVVLQPGSGSPLKAWAAERLAAVGAALAHELGARVAVTGSAAEHALSQQVCDLLPSAAINLAGALQWTELEALLSRAAVVVGVDSGPLHLAAAAGTPSVALFGPADPAQFGPWGDTSRHRVVTADLPCRPCRRLDWCALEPAGFGPPPCMRAISVEEVIHAARAALPERTYGSETTD